MTSTEPSGKAPDDLRRLALLLVEQSRADPDLHGLTASLQRVCRAVTDSLDLSGAAVHVMTGNLNGSAGAGAGAGVGVAACSDDESRAVAELQFTANEGPAIVAFRTKRPVLVPALDSVVTRWPGFVLLAIERGVRGLFAFPLQEGAVSFGVLELYADRAGPFDADRQAMAGAFARVATEVLLDGGTVTVTGELDAGLSASLVDRAKIHQAQGMVMVDLGVSLADALTRMRARAFATEITLLEVAVEVIAGQLTADTWINGDTAPDAAAT